MDGSVFGLPAHLIGGSSVHVVDAVLYGLTGLGLLAGVALFVSGRAGRAKDRER